jgi:carboxyl-terminal processing protease
VVLVDADSASASEVLAGALQDHRAAVVAGEATYGKGAVQSVLRLEDEDAVVKLTTAYYATPAGRVLERELAGESEPGIVPDFLVPIDATTRLRVREHLESYDPPEAARAELEAWERETGEVLLARAPEDPQLEAALALLRGDRPANAPR